MEDHAKKAAALARAELNHPVFLMAPGAKKAILALADAIERMAHEIEILKIRQGAGNGKQN